MYTLCSTVFLFAECVRKWALSLSLCLSVSLSPALLHTQQQASAWCLCRWQGSRRKAEQGSEAFFTVGVWEGQREGDNHVQRSELCVLLLWVHFEHASFSLLTKKFLPETCGFWLCFVWANKLALLHTHTPLSLSLSLSLITSCLFFTTFLCHSYLPVPVYR